MIITKYVKKLTLIIIAKTDIDDYILCVVVLIDDLKERSIWKITIENRI